MIRPRFSQADQPVHLSRAFVAQVARQVTRMMRDIPFPGGDTRGKGSHFGGGSPVMIGYPAVVVTAISQASGTSFGTGNVQLYYPSTPDTSALTADVDNASVPVRNWYTTSGTIATGKHCAVMSMGGAMWLLSWDC